MRRLVVSMSVVALMLTIGAVMSVDTVAAQRARCADFPSQAAAQAALPNNPQLDGDRDGIACENNPAPYATGIDRNRVNPNDDMDDSTTTTTTTMRTGTTTTMTTTRTATTRTTTAMTSPALPRTGGGGGAGGAMAATLLGLVGLSLVTGAVALRRRVGSDLR